MARSRSSSRNPRDVRNIANLRLGLRPLTLSSPPVFSRPASFPLPDDLRQFHPSRPHIRHSGFAVRPRGRRLSPFLGFVAPQRLALCVRRKIRREVMFAKGGAGSRRMRKPRRSFYSDVRC